METLLPSGRRVSSDSLSKSLKNPELDLIQGSPSIRKPLVTSKSISEQRRTTTDSDKEVYSAGQSLASILNNPHLGKAGVYGSDNSWSSWFFLGPTDNLEALPPLPLKPLPEITKGDFKAYLDSILDAYGRFTDVRDHSNRERSNLGAPTENGDDEREGGLKEKTLPGEGLVACLREIPSLYFKEDFALEDGSTFQAACPYASMPQNMVLQERLSRYLDTVEVHLVNEISARSDSFFEAQDQLEDLNANNVEACGSIQGLKSMVQLLDVDVVESARTIQILSQQRANLLSLYQKLKLMLYVKQALNALELLVAASDCGGALDVMDDLQHLLEGDDLVGLHCFRRLGDKLSSLMNIVNSTLAADFVHKAIHDSKDLESAAILLRYKKRDTLSGLSSIPDFLIECKDKGEYEAGLRDALLPLVIGLLRTSKLPSVLRIYRDTLIADIKAAIKTVVAELLPTLFTRLMDGDLQSSDRQADMEVGGASLASKLRSLSADSFWHLLAAVYDIVQVRLMHAAEVRNVIEQIVEGLPGSYAEAAVAAAFASGAAVAAAAEAAQEDQQKLLQSTPIRKSSQCSLPLTNDIEAPSPTTISRNFRADVLYENTEAVCAACEAAHDRWAKLLGVRALVHPKLRLQEFSSIFNITQSFMSATKKVGGRYASSIQIPLQSQSKAFVDFQHSARISKINAVLEQETWVAIDVPEEFQAIVKTLVYNESGNDQSDFRARERDGRYEDSNIADDLKNQSDSILPGSEVTSSDPASNGLHNETTSRENGIKQKDHNSQPVSDAASKNKRSREKATLKTLDLHEVGYHMVNSGLVLVKMMSEYIDISTTLPTLSPDVVHRIIEILKLFNSRTCQLVLGAGAMQVSGLKSITAKHLALASQCISFFHVLIPEMKRLLSSHLPESRKILLFTELDRVSQDYKVHRDEIHSKLVQIMKERLLIHLRSLPQIVDIWSKSEEQDSQPSPFARAVTKEVGVLHRVLSPILMEADVRWIFTNVVAMFHSQLADAFSKLDLGSPTVKQRLHNDVIHILACIRGLPSDAVRSDGSQKSGELDKFLQEKYGNEGPN